MDRYRVMVHRRIIQSILSLQAILIRIFRLGRSLRYLNRKRWDFKCSIRWVWIRLSSRVYRETCVIRMSYKMKIRHIRSIIRSNLPERTLTIQCKISLQINAMLALWAYSSILMITAFSLITKRSKRRMLRLLKRIRWRLLSYRKTVRSRVQVWCLRKMRWISVICKVSCRSSSRRRREISCRGSWPMVLAKGCQMI